MSTQTIPAATRLAACLILCGLAGSAAGGPVEPEVEAEEDVYTFTAADNGAGPMWCHGSTCLVRSGPQLFASGLETLTNARPLNNCRWMLFRRGPAGWEKILADPSGRTREPCPMAAFPDGRVFLSVNPTLVADPAAYSGPSRPDVIEFAAMSPAQPFRRLTPVWEGTPAFTEHSYRSFAADGPKRELILFQNIGYTHAEWAFLDGQGAWRVRGKLQWPWGADCDPPQPIRICYPNVALQNRAVHFCGVSDIVEPNRSWRAYKKQLTGRDWDYDFRRLFYTWTADITTGRFAPWIEIASREKTCGWITPGDLWAASNGCAHILWTERALDERLREKFFPDARQSHTLNYVMVREGKVLSRQVLLQAEEGGPAEVPGRARFQATPDGRLFVLFYVSGRDRNGRALSENRVLELAPGSKPSTAVRVPLKQPWTEFFTATERAGSPPSDQLEMLGQRKGSPLTISYARIRLNR